MFSKGRKLSGVEKFRINTVEVSCNEIIIFFFQALLSCLGGQKYLLKAIHFIFFLDPVREQQVVTERGSAKGSGQQIKQVQVLCLQRMHFDAEQLGKDTTGFHSAGSTFQLLFFFL